MPIELVAYLNSQGVDAAVTTSSQTIKLPQITSNIIIKNVGTAEAFVKGVSDATGTVTASATTATGGGMSILPGTSENYRCYGQTSSVAFAYLAFIGAGATTLRIYSAEGI